MTCPSVLPQLKEDEVGVLGSWEGCYEGKMSQNRMMDGLVSAPFL